MIVSLIRDFGDMYTHEFTLKPYTERLYERQHLALSSANSLRAAMKSFWKHLVYGELLNASMMKIDIDREIPSLKKKQHRTDAKDKRFFLDAARFREALEVANQIHPSHGAFTTVGLFFVARGAAIEDMRVKDLDREKRKIHIFETKTGYSASLPAKRIWSRLQPWLDYYENEHGALDPDWYLFPRISNGGLRRGDKFRPLIPTQRRSTEARFVEQTLLGMGYQKEHLHRIGTHTLRRSGVTWWYMKVEELYDTDQAVRFIMQLCGWATEREAMNYINPNIRYRWRDRVMEEIDFFGDDDLIDDGSSTGAIVLPFRTPHASPASPLRKAA
ncbi:hypothetical protein [Longispora urticae]